MADQSPGGPSRGPEPHAETEEGVAPAALAQPPLQGTGGAAATTPPSWLASAAAQHTAGLASAQLAGPPKHSRPAPTQPHQVPPAGLPLQQQHIEQSQQPQAHYTPGLAAPVAWEQWARREEAGAGAAVGPGPAGDWGGIPASFGGIAVPPERLSQLLAALQGLPPQQAPLHEVGVAQQEGGPGQPREPSKTAATAAAEAAQPPAMAAAHPMGQRRQELEQLWAAYGGAGPEDTQRFVAALQQQQQQHRSRGEQAGGEEQQQSAAQHGPAGGSGRVGVGGEGGATEGVGLPEAGAGPVATLAEPIAPSPFLGRTIPGYQPPGPQNPAPAHQEQHQQQQGDSTAMLMVPTLPLEERPARSTSLNFQLESSSFSLPLPQPSLPQPVLRPAPEQRQQQEQQLAVQAGGAGGAQARQGTPALQAALSPPPPPQQQQPAARQVLAAGAEDGAVGCSDGHNCPGDGQENEGERPPAVPQPALQPAIGDHGPPAQRAVALGDPQQQQLQQEGAHGGTLAGSWVPEPTLNPAGQSFTPQLQQVAAEAGPTAAAGVEAQPPAAVPAPLASAGEAAAGEAPGVQLAANPHLQLLRVLFSIQVHIEAALLGVQAAVSAEVPELAEQVAVLGQLQTQEDPWLQQLAAAILRILQSVQQWVSTLAPPPTAAQATLTASPQAPPRQQELQQERQQQEQGALPDQGPRLQLAQGPQPRGDAETAAEALVSFMSAKPPHSGEKPSARPAATPGSQLPGPGLAAAAAQQGQQQQLEQQAQQAEQLQAQQQAQLEQLLVARAVHKRRAEEAAAAHEGAGAEDVWGPAPKRALTQALMWARQPFPGTGRGAQEPSGAEGQQLSPAEAAATYGQQGPPQEYFLAAAAGDPAQSPGSPPAYLQLLRQRLALLQQQQQHQQGALPPLHAAARAWPPQQPAAAIPPVYQQAEAPPALAPQWGPPWGGPREAALAQAYQPPYQAAQQAAGQGAPLHGYGYPAPGQPPQGWFPPQPPHQLAYHQPPPAQSVLQPGADPQEHVPWEVVRLRSLLHHQQQQQQLQGEAGAAFGRGHLQRPVQAPVAPGVHQAPLQWPPPPAQPAQQQQPLWEGPAVDHLRLRVAALAAALGSAAAPPGMGWDEQQALPAAPAAAGRPPLPAGFQAPGGWAPAGPLGPHLGQGQAREELYVPRAGPMGPPGAPQQQQQHQQPLPGGYPSLAAAAAEPTSARAPAAQSGWAAPPQPTPALTPAGYQPWGLPAQQFGQGGAAPTAQQGGPGGPMELQQQQQQAPPPTQQQQQQEGQQGEEADPEEAAAMAAQLRAVLARYFAHGPPGPGN